MTAHPIPTTHYPIRAVAARARAVPLRNATLVVPFALLVAGALVGLPFTLDAPVAWQRLIGLLAAGAIAVLVLPWLRRPGNAQRAFAVAIVLALGGGLWVIAAAGPDVFQGALGSRLQAVFAPLFWHVTLTVPVAVTNTWFIVGYNGLADLCLLAWFASLGWLVSRPSPAVTVVCVAVCLYSVALLLATDARGALAGLVVGTWLAAMVAWRHGWLLLVLLPLAVVVAALGPKGLDLSSTLGRVSYWSDLTRLLSEFPFTGVGLGVDTANRVALLYEVNPDPERIAYAHNTFIQAYLEQGPLGFLGMLAVPVLGAVAVIAALRGGVADASRRGLLVAGVGLLAGLEVHGLTDQVVTTNVGTLLVFLALAAILAALQPSAQVVTERTARWLGVGVVAVLLAALLATLVLPGARSRALLNLGGLHLVQAWAASPTPAERSAQLAAADGPFSQGLALDPSQPALLRDQARVRVARYDDPGALDLLKRATAAPGLDAFDLLQIAHLYRDLGFDNDAYTWATRAYAAWGRPQADTDPILLVYKRETLADSPNAQTLADQGEAAMTARDFSAAAALFQQALTFSPDNSYLQDRLGAAQRGVEKYGG